MKKFLLSLVVLISASAYAQKSLTDLSVFAANSAICKEKIISQFSDDLISCIDDFRNTRLIFSYTIQTYPGIDVYNFSKKLLLDEKELICSGEIKISFYSSLKWIDGMGFTHDVKNALAHQISKMECK